MRAHELLTEMYRAYELDKKSRQILAATFPPKYPDFIGQHITYKMGNKSGLPPMPNTVAVIGYADDGESLEALVVAVDGSTDRVDGSIYHITWSLDRSKGRKPVDSNKLVASGFKPVDPISIQVEPKIL